MNPREFRAWDKDREKFIANFAIMQGECFIEENPVNNNYVELYKNGKQETYYSDWATYHQVTAILEQYTGLKDSKGVKIFEGDIVKTQNKYITKIVYGHNFDERGDLWSSLSFMRVGLTEEPSKFKGQDSPVYFCGSSIFYDLESIEIIGNIHEGTK